VIIAEKQTSGKGRLGRKWISPKGGIWLSIILQPKFDISVITLFPIASALALSNAIEKTLSIKSELKWPNDITIKGKKVAGMLVDASLESNKIENLILGVGINFNVDIRQIEKNLKNTPNFYGIASLSEQNKTVKSILLVQSFLMELEHMYNLLNDGDTKKIIRDWTRRSSTIGQNIELSTEDGKIRGKAIKIDEDGALVILENKKNRRITSGDITHISKWYKQNSYYFFEDFLLGVDFFLFFDIEGVLDFLFEIRLDCSLKIFLRSFWISKTTVIMSSSTLEYWPYADSNSDCFLDTLVRYSLERKRLVAVINSGMSEVGPPNSPNSDLMSWIFLLNS